MTGLLHEKEFSRRSFLKGTGALVVGFSIAGAGLAGKASATAPARTGYLPDPAQVDSWISVLADNSIVFRSGSQSAGPRALNGVFPVAASALPVPYMLKPTTSAPPVVRNFFRESSFSFRRPVIATSLPSPSRRRPA